MYSIELNDNGQYEWLFTTCIYCSDSKICAYAYDEYNTSGECLMMK